MSKVLTLPEVAPRLGVSLRHLRTLDARGELPFVRQLGRRRVVPEVVLEAWLMGEKSNGDPKAAATTNIHSNHHEGGLNAV